MIDHGITAVSLRKSCDGAAYPARACELGLGSRVLHVLRLLMVLAVVRGGCGWRGPGCGGC